MSTAPDWFHRVCEGCGAVFRWRRYDQRHCSPACRVKAYRARRRNLELEESVTPRRAQSVTHQRSQNRNASLEEDDQ